jgi:purine-binding chemotaxis protein CheW
MRLSPMNQALDVPASSTSRWVTFLLDGETYGIDVLQVQEVLRVAEVALVPGAPDYVLGIINLRGSIVTVVDSHRRFGVRPRQPDDATRIIIVDAAEQVVGIVVDNVTGVVEVPHTAVEKAPNVGGQEKSRFIHGLCSRKEGLLILVDVNKLLSESEWNDLETW